MRDRKIFFHPLVVLAAAAAAILCYVVMMRWRFPGGNLANHFFYTLPILVPFVAFLFDRARTFRDASLLDLTVDSAVVFTSIARGLALVPIVSGHVLFLTFAIVRPGSRLTKITAALVMLQVIYLKLVIWHDPVSPFAGIVLGTLAAYIVRRAAGKTTDSLTPLPDSK